MTIKNLEFKSKAITPNVTPRDFSGDKEIQELEQELSNAQSKVKDVRQSLSNRYEEVEDIRWDLCSTKLAKELREGLKAVENTPTYTQCEAMIDLIKLYLREYDNGKYRRDY